jgi:hypothetical protein
MKLPTPPPHLKAIRDVEISADISSWTIVDSDSQVWHNDFDNDTEDWAEIVPLWMYDPETLKILVITPMHPGYGIKPQTWKSVQAAIDVYDGPIDWFISKGDNPYADPYENVTHQHNKARQMVLNGDYDALLSIEADMIIPPDTIDKLINADADIAYGLYIWRHHKPRWSAYKTLGMWGGESVSLNHNGEDVRKTWGKIIDVAGLGMGCTLIKRNVLHHLPFRLHDGQRSWITDEYADDFKKMGIDPHREHKKMVCDDWLFAMDAQHFGFTQRANLSVVCGHISNDSILWPDPEADKFYWKENIKEI